MDSYYRVSTTVNNLDLNYCLMMVAWRSKHVAIIKISIWISIDCIIIFLCWGISHFIICLGNTKGRTLQKYYMRKYVPYLHIHFTSYFPYFDNINVDLKDHLVFCMSESESSLNNFWTTEPIVMNLDMYIMPPEAIWTTYFTNPSHQ
jgi:hypothetical protein